MDRGDNRTLSSGLGDQGRALGSVARDDRRELYNGFGDTLARAFEFVGTPVLFAFFGHTADGKLGTRPLFTVGLVVFAVAGVFVRMYYGYEAAMREHEARAPWQRPGPAS